MLTIKIKKNRVGPVINRHPWIFSGALENIPNEIESGEPLKLTDEAGNFLAQGYFNSYSQIAVRLWSYDELEEIDESFFVKRIENANEIRKKYVESPLTDSYRLINSENDMLPGLIVDKYADYLVLQFHTRGIERWRQEIISALEKVLSPKGIYERSDIRSQEREGKEKISGLLSGEVPDLITIKENGLKFLVDVKEGQKTGFFLDQREKRQALEKYSNGQNVLNCFSYTGGFSVYALRGGAKKVVSVDVSEKALDLAKENFKLNKMDLKKCEFVREDVKQYLNTLEKGTFETIVLDPPAFIKDRKKKKEGVLGYKKINEVAMKLLPQNGILATSSCSAHLSKEEFRFLLTEAGGRARKTLQILESYTHGIDHPELTAFIESEYLKSFFLLVN